VSSGSTAHRSTTRGLITAQHSGADNRWQTVATNGIVQQQRAGKIVEMCAADSSDFDSGGAALTAIYINSPHWK
jgi:hypothetical protein